MSVLTGVMLICSLADGDDDPDSFAMADIQRWLAEQFEGLQLRDVSRHAGGGKSPQFASYCGGFNYMRDHEQAFAEFVTTRMWCHPEEMVLVLRPENGPCEVFRADPSVSQFPEEWGTA